MKNQQWQTRFLCGDSAFLGQCTKRALGLLQFRPHPMTKEYCSKHETVQIRILARCNLTIMPTHLRKRQKSIWKRRQGLIKNIKQIAEEFWLFEGKNMLLNSCKLTILLDGLQIWKLSRQLSPQFDHVLRPKTVACYLVAMCVVATLFWWQAITNLVYFACHRRHCRVVNVAILKIAACPEK